MSRSLTSSYFRSGLSYIRRHAGKIAFITLATTGAVAAASYMRKQVHAVNQSIETERVEGARRLRLVFVKNNKMICSAFRVLLPKIGALLDSSEAVDVHEQLEKLRQKPKNKDEKQKLWNHVKEASITHLIASVYLLSLLYSLLALQMNLLARYAHVNVDAPVQSLPSGSLQTKTSKRFLELTRKNLLNSDQILRLITSIKSIVRTHVSKMNLTAMTSIDDVKDMCRNILQDLHLDKESTQEESVAADDPLSETMDNSLWDWALRDENLNEDEDDANDLDYEFLIHEAIDLGEVLDFGELITHNSCITLSYALNCLKQDLELSQKKNPLPFAHLFAHFSDIGSRLLSDPMIEQKDEETTTIIDGELSELETRLSEDLHTSRFAACVFLSGEKEGTRGQTNLQQERPQISDQTAVPSPYVTNISHPVEEESEDLGLMFDIRQTDS